MVDIKIGKGELDPSKIKKSLERVQPPSKQLHSNGRLLELKRITNENYHLLRRLKQTKSVYNVVKWEVENAQKDALLRVVSRSSKI